jgi:hypothetical protein
MATVQRRDERRRFSRITFRRAARLSAGSAATQCSVLDVSLRGALLEIPAAFEAEVDWPCSLVIYLDEGEAVIRLDGAVAHREGMTVGVRCTAIDLESIGHLRRLVELNLADEQLLHRELGALIGRDAG